jgi:hypothetical protein
MIKQNTVLVKERKVKIKQNMRFVNMDERQSIRQN